MSIVVSMWMGALLAVTPPGASGCLIAPVTTGITARFVPPSCPYCAGHRTLDFSAMIGADVVAPIDGTVTFAGVVAGSTYITISAPERSRIGPFDSGTSRSGISRSGISRSGISRSDELRDSTYLVTIGGVTANPDVMSGSRVVAGRRIGSVSTEPVRLSLRRTVPGGEAKYLDPEDSLVRWRTSARLVPPPGTVVGRVVTRTWTCRKPL
jgi:hypothetical protein